MSNDRDIEAAAALMVEIPRQLQKLNLVEVSGPIDCKHCKQTVTFEWTPTGLARLDYGPKLKALLEPRIVMSSQAGGPHPACAATLDEIHALTDALATTNEEIQQLRQVVYASKTGPTGRRHLDDLMRAVRDRAVRVYQAATGRGLDD